MWYLAQSEDTLCEVLASAARDGTPSEFCIGNTAKIGGGGLFFLPIRRTRQLVAGSVLVYRAEEAVAIAEAVGGRVDYILVDIERAEARGLRVLRANIRAGFQGQVAMLLEMERLLGSEIGRGEIGGLRIVSGGLLGRCDEFVVDSISHPTTVFGIADGHGDFIRNLSVEQREALAELRARLAVRP